MSKPDRPPDIDRSADMCLLNVSFAVKSEKDQLHKLLRFGLPCHTSGYSATSCVVNSPTLRFAPSLFTKDAKVRPAEERVGRNPDEASKTLFNEWTELANVDCPFAADDLRDQLGRDHVNLFGHCYRSNVSLNELDSTFFLLVHSILPVD